MASKQLNVSMKKIGMICVFFFINAGVFAQDYIYEDKGEVKQLLKNYNKQYKGGGG